MNKQERTRDFNESSSEHVGEWMSDVSEGVIYLQLDIAPGTGVNYDRQRLADEDSRHNYRC